VIPFFKKYSLIGIKQLDYLDWCKIAKKIVVKKYLSYKDLELIRIIKAGMNKGRKLKI